VLNSPGFEPATPSARSRPPATARTARQGSREPEEVPAITRLCGDLTAGDINDCFEVAIALLARGLEAMLGERGDEDGC
jgi:hypothetical protein